MNSVTLPSSWDSYRILDETLRRSARKAYRLWAANPFHPSLHFECINREEDVWSVRVTLSHRAVERDPLVAARAPLLAETIPHIAWPQIRNRGAFGGSIAHADPAGHLPAIAIVLNGRYHVRSNKKNDRWLNSDEFFVAAFTTALELDELLVDVALPPVAPRSGWSYRQAAAPGAGDSRLPALAGRRRPGGRAGRTLLLQ